MAFQPFQLPNARPWGDVGNAIVDAYQARTQRDAMLAQQLRGDRDDSRQAQQDFQASLLKAHAAAAAGDYDLARSIMAPYGGQMGQRAAADAPDWSPKLNQDEVSFADSLGQFQGAPQGAPGQAPAPGSGEASDAAEEGVIQQRLNPQPPPNMLASAAQADQAKKQRMAKFLNGVYNGQQWTIDPEAARQAQQERSDKAFYDASGEDSDMADIVREQYPAQRAAAMAAGQTLDAQQTLKDFQGEAKLRRQEGADAARIAHQDAQQQLQWAMGVMRDQRSDENNRRMAAAILGAASMRGSGQDNTNNRGWNAQGETLLKNYTSSQGYSKQVEGLRSYENMLADLKSGNTALMMGGLGAWVKEKSGGSAVVTENEIKRYLQSSIPWTTEMERQFNYWAKGDTRLDQKYVKPFTDALESTIISRQKGIIERIGKGAKASFLADENPEIQAQANAAYTRTVSPLLAPEQLDAFIKEREAQRDAAPAPVPAKKAKGGATQPAPPRQSAAPRPMTPAIPQLSPADQAMAARAMETIKNSPGSPLAASARKWLAAHGVEAM
jgi:hypothetical protein